MLKLTNKKIRKWLWYTVITVIIICIVIIFHEYYNKYINIFKSQEKIKGLILSYGKYSIVAFLIMQIIQVVAFFIPGELIQIAGGYIFGTIVGSVISIVGIGIGSIVVFIISNKLGKVFVSKIVSKEKFNSFTKILNNNKQNRIIFILYLIPGLPKDVLGYICGIANVHLKDFIIYSNLGRIPCIVLSAYFGSHMFHGNKLIPISIGIVATFLFGIGVIKGEKILKKMLKNKK